jgi:predicted dehydrogenase
MIGAVPSSDASLRLAVAGCGRVFERCHLPALQASRHIRLVAAYDPLDSRRAWLATAAPGVPAHGSLDELLNAHEVDAVLIASPPATHAALTLRALEAGAHVLVEKPMTTTADEAERVVEVALRTGRVVQTGFNRRFYPGFVSLRRLVDRLDAAEIRSIYGVLLASRDAWGRVSTIEEDTGEPEVLADLAPHHLDLLPWLTRRPGIAVRADDHAVRGTPGGVAGCRLELAGELRGTLVVGRAPTYVEHVEVALENRVLFASANSSFTARPENLAWRRRLHGLLARLAEPLGRLSGGRDFLVACAARQLAAFAAAVGRGIASEMAAGARDGLANARLIEAWRRSILAGGALQVVATPERGGG